MLALPKLALNWLNEITRNGKGNRSRSVGLMSSFIQPQSGAKDLLYLYGPTFP